MEGSPSRYSVYQRSLFGEISSVLSVFPFTSELSLEIATFSTLLFNLKGLPIFLNA